MITTNDLHKQTIWNIILIHKAKKKDMVTQGTLDQSRNFKNMCAAATVLELVNHFNVCIYTVFKLSKKLLKNNSIK